MLSTYRGWRRRVGFSWKHLESLRITPEITTSIELDFGIQLHLRFHSLVGYFNCIPTLLHPANALY